MNVYAITIRGQRGLNDMQQPLHPAFSMQEVRAATGEPVQHSNIFGVFGTREGAEEFLYRSGGIGGDPALFRQMPRIEEWSVDELTTLTFMST